MYFINSDEPQTYSALREPFLIVDKFTMTHLTGVCVYNAPFNLSIHLAYRKVFFFRVFLF